ncbi:MAG: iron chelate uptake ABC transporter family permease subunit, partial [Hylemonella sp.]
GASTAAAGSTWGWCCRWPWSGWALPWPVLAGALLLVLADLAARTLVAYADLPLGMLTSLVGGPFFFWLLRRARRTAGGWA